MKATEYVVKVSTARMPSSCKGSYARIGVMEIHTDQFIPPGYISNRSRGVERVVSTWESIHVGRTKRCEFSKRLQDAIELATELNGGVSPEIFYPSWIVQGGYYYI